MKMLLYILLIKSLLIFLLFAFVFNGKGELNINNNFDDNDLFLFKTFVVDHAVTGM